MVNFKKPIINEKLEIDPKLHSEHTSMYRMITNPTGKSSAMVANRGLMIEALDGKFVKLLKDHTFKTKIYHDEKNNIYVYHVKVPSETSEKLHYDVVIEVSPADNGSTIKEPAKFFSNDPHFIYTYAHVLFVNDKIPDWLTPKLNKPTKKQEPKIKNPLSSLGFVKSIYYAIKYLRYTDLLNINRKDVKNFKLKYNQNAILHSISTFDEMLVKVKKAKKIGSKNKTKKKKTVTRITKVVKRKKK